MIPSHPSTRPRRRLGARTGGAALAGLAALVLAAVSFSGLAQPGPSSPVSVSPGATVGTPTRRPHAEEGVRWHKLKPAQREALAPLLQEWSGIDAAHKQKWLQVADRLSRMPPAERVRVQDRMTDWVKLTPVERGQARLRYEESRQIPSPDRRSRWAAYQALSPEEKNALAARAAAARAANAAEAAARHRAGSGSRLPEHADRGAHDVPQAKSNIVPNPAYSAHQRPIGPTVVQAAPGATTTYVTRRPSPPPHQQTGLPKIAATPEFVNKSTLLPQRGAQGAAVRPALASDPVPAARR